MASSCYINDFVRIEVEFYHSIVKLWILSFFIDRKAFANLESVQVQSKVVEYSVLLLKLLIYIITGTFPTIFIILLVLLLNLIVLWPSFG